MLSVYTDVSVGSVSLSQPPNTTSRDFSGGIDFLTTPISTLPPSWMQFSLGLTVLSAGSGKGTASLTEFHSMRGLYLSAVKTKAKTRTRVS